MSAAALDRTWNRLRVRWAAIGAAVAVTLGAGTVATVHAIQTSGERLTYVATTPCRLIDTRPEPQFNVGARTTPLGPTEAITVDARGAQGNCTPAELPTDAAALVLNVTAPTATADGFLTIWPDGPRPDASSLNPSPAAPPAPNSVTTDLSATGTFNVYNENGFTHLIIDVVGHYVDHHHDDRYYTEGEIDAALATKADAGGVYSATKLVYDGEFVTIAGSPSSKLRDIGTFDSSGGIVKVTWGSQVRETGGTVCNFGIRINGTGSGPVLAAGLVATDATVIDGVDWVMTVDLFENLPAGTHDVDLFVRGLGGSTCSDNFGNYTNVVLIEEFPAP